MSLWQPLTGGVVHTRRRRRASLIMRPPKLESSFGTPQAQSNRRCGKFCKPISTFNSSSSSSYSSWCIWSLIRRRWGACKSISQFQSSSNSLRQFSCCRIACRRNPTWIRYGLWVDLLLSLPYPWWQHWCDIFSYSLFVSRGEGEFLRGWEQLSVKRVGYEGLGFWVIRNSGWEHVGPPEPSGLVLSFDEKCIVFRHTNLMERTL